MALSVIAKIDKKTGKISIEGDGFKGTGCIEKLDKLLAFLRANGAEVTITKDVLKDEYYLPEAVQEGVQQG